MIKYFIIISLSCHISLSTNECNRTIPTAGQISFLCPSSISDQTLALYDLSVTQLDSITSIMAGGWDNNTVGPFTSLPPNLCLLRNLKSIDFSFNQIIDVDPTGSLTYCLSNVISLNLRLNNISQFPSVLIYNMLSLTTLNFQSNQLTDIPVNAFRNVSLLDTIDFSHNQLTSFELWALEVITKADFSYNLISTITNKYFFDTFLNTTSSATIYLTQNRQTINLTDAVYEMYNQCGEASAWLSNGNISPDPPFFTGKIARINFGTTLIDCNCDQRDLLQILRDSYGTIDSIPSTLPIRTAACVRVKGVPNSLFINSSCITTPFDVNSTVDFSQVYPRLCTIFDYENNDTTIPLNISAPTLNVSTYPHYETAFMNPGACFFTFTNQTTMNIICTNDTSNSLSTIPNALFNSTYMSNIIYVTFPSPISSLPSYLCSLPSGEINLSYQAFTTLTDATFPCLDSFNKVILSHNNLVSVNMASGNFQKLSSLDLSSNLLTTIPYSILRPTPSSLHYLDLRNNSITAIDLFLYTLKNITVYLDNNPINSSNIINPQNITLNSNSTSSANITLPPNAANNTIIIQDSTIANLFTCSILISVQNLINILQSANTVRLQCTCASFGLRQLYRTNGSSITNSITCSSVTDAQTFQSLTNADCSNAVNFSTAVCPTNSQISTDMTTMNSLNTSIEYTSTSITIIITNSSISSPSTLNTSNQTQGTTPSGNSTSSGGTTPSSGTTLSGNVTSSENSTASRATTPLSGTTLSGTVTSSGNSTSSGATTPSSGTTLSGNVTSSGNSTASGATTPSSGTTLSGNVTSSGNSTSSGATTPSSGTTLSGNVTSSGNSTVSGVTTPSGGTTISGNVTTTASTGSSTTAAPPLQSGAGGNSTSDRTGLIVGLVVGIVGFFILVGAVVIAILCFKSKSAAGAKKKPINRAAVIGQAPGDSLSTRVQPRNLRAVRLAPIPSASTSVLPKVPVKAVVPPTNSSLLSYPNTTLRTPAKGIPVRLDAIRSPSEINPQYPPNSNALNNSSSFRPIHNVSAHQAEVPQQQYQAPKPQKPQANQLLNTGGDIRH